MSTLKLMYKNYVIILLNIITESETIIAMFLSLFTNFFLSKLLYYRVPSKT